MTKRFRLFIIVLLVAVSGWFLYPTVAWYFYTPTNLKELASSSREQIRDYAQKQAKDKLDELRALKEKDAKAPLPSELEFILPLAKHNYDTAKLPQPAAWTVLDVFK